MKYHTLLNLRTALAAVIFAAIYTASAEKVSEVVEQTFNVTPGQTLAVDVFDGDIEIAPHDKNIVAITLLKRAEALTATKAQERLDAYQVKFDQNANGVLIKTLKREQQDWSFWNHTNFSANYTILVPRSFRCTIVTSDGDVRMEGISGDQEVISSDGDLTLVGIIGNASLTTSDGDVVVTDLVGDLEATSSDGDLIVKGIEGKTDVRTSDGDVQLKNLRGEAMAFTSDGEVFVELLSQPQADCTFRTTDGDITLVVPETIQAEFDVSVTDGAIDFDFPVDSLKSWGESQHFTQKINGGGPSIRLSTTDGKISIEKK
jgi:DUF4097 and DUF4098 domain-containing protein YvlB